MRRLLTPIVILGLLAVAAWWIARNTAVGSEFVERIVSGSKTRAPTSETARESGSQAIGEAPAPTAPRAAAGEPLLIDLVERPNSHYSKARWTGTDETYASLTHKLPNVTYDPLLGHAARELAAFYALERQMAPSGGLQFILDAAGAPEWDVLRTMLVTNDTGLGALRKRIERLAEDAQGPIRIGVGESYPAAPPLRRYLAILVSTSPLRLDPVPRRVPAGRRITLSGRLPRTLTKLRAVVSRPDGEWITVKAVRGADSSFVADVEPGDEAGMLSIELIADQRTGPHPLAQLELAVGVPLATMYEGNWPPDESHIRTDTDAEALALDLLNDDRQRARLEPLRRDPVLDQVARRHSRDMRDHGFTGHTSPTTGSLGDRLADIRYSALFRAENIATNQSLHDAQAGLLASLAHRRNILAVEPNTVGIGVAIRRDRGKQIFYLTQVFAKPARLIDLDEARAQVRKRLTAARERKGMRALRWDPRLARVAAQVARLPGASPSMVLERAKKLAQRGAAAAVSTLGQLKSLEIPKLSTDRRYKRLGVGVYQRPAERGKIPTIVVVIIAAG